MDTNIRFRMAGRGLLAAAALAGLAGLGVAVPTHAAVKRWATRSETVTVHVQANNPDWTDTGVSLKAHHDLVIRAHNKVNDAPDHPTWPNGASVASYGCTLIAGPLHEPFVAPQLRCWSLIGKIGNGQPFQVSGNLTVLGTTSGELFLMMNDSIGTFGDNSGQWTVAITTA
jgi:hypothetical protein